jgi:hypothetical protein
MLVPGITPFITVELCFMRRVRAGWLTLILTLFVLWVPVQASADWYSNWSGEGGGPSDPGDPDNPQGPRLSPGWRSGGTGGDAGYQSPRLVPTDRSWMRRYLILLSGLRSFYLRF